MNSRRLVLVLVFFFLSCLFVLSQGLGGIAHYIDTRQIAQSLWGSFGFAVQIVGFVLFASLIGALYLVSEGK